MLSTSVAYLSADVEHFLKLCHDPGIAPEPRIPESHWKISHGFEETLHLLRPLSGSYVSTRAPLPEQRTTSGHESQAA